MRAMGLNKELMDIIINSVAVRQSCVFKYYILHVIISFQLYLTHLVYLVFVGNSVTAFSKGNNCSGFPGGSTVKNLSANAGDLRDAGLNPGLGRSLE